MRTSTVVYAGMDAETWILLVDAPALEPRAAACIPALLTHRTYNPCNIVWKRLYRQYRDRRRASLVGLRLLTPFVTSGWRKYHAMFLSVVRNKAALLDFEDTDTVVRFMEDNTIDLLVVNAWGMLPAAVINAPRSKTVNVHPSKLPQYRGAVPTLMSLKNHDKESAVSYIVLEERMDAGMLIGQHTFGIDERDDYHSAETKIAAIVRSTLIEDITRYLADGKGWQQDESQHSVTPAYRRYMRLDCEQESAADIFNKVNAYPFIEIFDYCYGYFNGRKVFLKSIKQANNPVSMLPGTFRVCGWTVYIMAQDGGLRCVLFGDIGSLDSLQLLVWRSGTMTKRGEKL